MLRPIFFSWLVPVAWLAVASHAHAQRPRFSAPPPASAPAVGVRAAIHTAGDTLFAGEMLSVAIGLSHEPGWHTYWTFPGDAGGATILEWSLPGGVLADTVSWPVPRRFDTLGEASFGYTNRMAASTRLALPLHAAPVRPSAVTVTVRVGWLACQVQCIPGADTLTFRIVLAPERAAPARLTAAAQALSERHAAANGAVGRQQWPEPLPASAGARATRRGGTILLRATLPDEASVQDVIFATPGVKLTNPQIAQRGRLVVVRADTARARATEMAALLVTAGRSWLVVVPIDDRPE